MRIREMTRRKSAAVCSPGKGIIMTWRRKSGRHTEKLLTAMINGQCQDTGMILAQALRQREWGEWTDTLRQKGRTFIFW